MSYVVAALSNDNTQWRFIHLYLLFLPEELKHVGGKPQ